MKFNFKRIWQSGLAGMAISALVAVATSGFGFEMPGLLSLLLIGGIGALSYFVFSNNNWWI